MTTTATNAPNGANMTEPHIERFGPDVSIGSLIEAIDRDGVAMVEDAIPPELLSALNAEFDGLIAGTEPGTPNHIPMLIDFMGAQDASGSTASRASRRRSSTCCSTRSRSRWPTTTSCRRASTTC